MAHSFLINKYKKLYFSDTLKIFITIVLFLFPYKFRKYMLSKLFGYQIAQNARIGYSIIIPASLEMGENSYIGHLTICKGIQLKMDKNSHIGNLN